MNASLGIETRRAGRRPGLADGDDGDENDLTRRDLRSTSSCVRRNRRSHE